MMRKAVLIGKIALKIGFCLLIFLLIFVNFYSYSMLTRIAYSFIWLLEKTPLMSAQSEEIFIPSALSTIFHWLHSLKWAIGALQAMFFDDGFPAFDGKYHWLKNELAMCNVAEDTLFKGQFNKNPKLQCHIYAIIPLMFVRVELFSVDPPILKFHEFLPPKRITEFVHEIEMSRLSRSRINVHDGLGKNIWQDSIVVNDTFIHPFSTPSLKSTFVYIQQRISAFNFGRSELYNVGGHYAPHLDILAAKPDELYGNRIATFMLIVQPADIGGGTVFPDIGYTFMPKAGDALLWLNMMPDYSVVYGSLHGACPVLAGSKIGITMWIRSVTQELRLPSPLQFGQHYDFKRLVNPKGMRPAGAKLWE